MAIAIAAVILLVCLFGYKVLFSPSNSASKDVLKKVTPLRRSGVRRN